MKYLLLIALIFVPFTAKAYSIDTNYTALLNAQGYMIKGDPSDLVLLHTWYDLQGTHLNWTIDFTDEEIPCNIALAVGCTDFQNKTITIDQDTSFDWVLWREYYHASTNTCSEAKATEYANNQLTAHGWTEQTWIVPEAKGCV